MNINPFDILKNAQKIQEGMGGFQEKLAAIAEKGSAGGGMVEVELSGRLEVLSVNISPEAVAPADVEMLEDLVAAAFTAASEKVKERLQKELGALAGMSIPGLFGG